MRRFWFKKNLFGTRNLERIRLNLVIEIPNSSTLRLLLEEVVTRFMGLTLKRELGVQMKSYYKLKL